MGDNDDWEFPAAGPTSPDVPTIEPLQAAPVPVPARPTAPMALAGPVGVTIETCRENARFAAKQESSKQEKKVQRLIIGLLISLLGGALTAGGLYSSFNDLKADHSKLSDRSDVDHDHLTKLNTNVEILVGKD